MNKVILMGRLTKDPEIRYTGTGEPIAIARYTIAVSRPYKKDGQTQADFINVVSYGKAAEFIEKYFKKGQMIAIVGRLQVRSWDNSEGKRHWVTEVVTDEIHFAGGKNENGSATQAAPLAPQTHRRRHSLGYIRLPTMDSIPLIPVLRMMTYRSRRCEKCVV